MAGDNLIVSRIGPFNGGLNNWQDPFSIADNELAELVNYDIDYDGSLVNRPVMVTNPEETGGGGPGSNATLRYATLPIVIGRHRDGGSLLYKSANGKIYYERLNDAGESAGGPGLVAVTPTGETNLTGHCMAQYGDYLYLTNPTKDAYKGRTLVASTALAVIPTMPLAETLFPHKERLFAIPGPKTTDAVGDAIARVYFTDAGYTGGNWNVATNFFAVGFGDGQRLVSGLSYNGDVILFKTDSTWRLTYTTSITSGVVQVVNSNIGLANPHAWTTCKGLLYAFYDDDMYEIYNYQWTNVSHKIKFDRVVDSFTADHPDYVDGVSVGNLGNRVIVNYYGNTYVYNVELKVWAKWESTRQISRMLNIPGTILDDFDREAIIAGDWKNQIGGVGGNLVNMVRIIDETVNSDQSTSETYEPRITTKAYDLDASTAFKRLMWWSADILGRADVQSTAVVITNTANVTFDDMDADPIGFDNFDLATWDNPLSILPKAENMITSLKASVGRRLVKFLKSMRFRQIYFTFSTTLDGTGATQPSRLFFFTAFIKGKGKVSKQSN